MVSLVGGAGSAPVVEIQPAQTVDADTDQQNDTGAEVSGQNRGKSRKCSSGDQSNTHTVQRAEHGHHVTPWCSQRGTVTS